MSLVVGRLSFVGFANDRRQTTNDGLPRRLRNPWNLSAQRQAAEAQAADAELAQKRARASAQVAAVVLARRKLGFLYLVLV
jgi:hypothetical protein